jgi:ribosomal protein S24E
MRTKSKIKKKTTELKLIQIKKITIKRVRTKSFGEKTWRVDMKCYNGWHKNQGIKKKKQLSSNHKELSLFNPWGNRVVTLSTSKWNSKKTPKL